MDNRRERIMEAVDDNITHWCTNCPDADHFIADLTGPEEWVCSKRIYPGDEKCCGGQVRGHSSPRTADSGHG